MKAHIPLNKPKIWDISSHSPNLTGLRVLDNPIYLDSFLVAKPLIPNVSYFNKE